MSFEEFKEFHNSNYHDGDSTFDERHYKKSNGDDFDSDFVQDCYDHFEAGAQSRQAEIDELIDMVKTSVDSEMFLFEELQRVDKDRDELQKRIDQTIEWIESNKKNIPLSEWHGYTTKEYVDADDLFDILKWKNND